MALRAATQHQPYEPGDIVAGGKYRVEALIGTGAFGQVYRVRHLGLDGARALKVIRKDAPGVGSTNFQGYQERLHLEFQLAERLKHRNVIAIYDLIDQPEALYAEMELAEGGTVAELLRKEGRLPADRVVAILRDAAEGLAALHQAGAVHRDVKPANLLISADGTVKVSDLGLAQWAAGGGDPGDSFGGSTTTRHPGSVDYSSPEHDLLQPLLPTSDVYSLGCVAFELITGRQWKTVQYQVASAADLRPDVPPGLNALVMGMLADTPGIRDEAHATGGKRFASMGGVLAALAALAEPPEKPKSEPDPTETSPAYKQLLIALEGRDFVGALAAMDTLEAESFALIDLAPLRQRAELGRRQQQRKTEAERRYNALAALAPLSTMQDMLSAEWSRFRVDFPEHDDDPAHLELWIQARADAAQETETEERRKAEAEAEARRQAAAYAEAQRQAEAEAQRQAAAEADAKRQTAAMEPSSYKAPTDAGPAIGLAVVLVLAATAVASLALLANGKSTDFDVNRAVAATLTPRPSTKPPVVSASAMANAATVTASPTLTAAVISLSADKTDLTAGECTTLRWTVKGVRSYSLNGVGKAGDEGSEKVCPQQNTTYKLTAILLDGSESSQEVRIKVRAALSTAALPPRPGHPRLLPANATDTVSAQRPIGATETAKLQPEERPTFEGSLALVVDGFAKISGTDGDGSRLRFGFGLDTLTIRWVEEGETVKILGGPEASDGYTWFRVQDSQGNLGWVATDFLSATQRVEWFPPLVSPPPP